MSDHSERLERLRHAVGGVRASRGPVPFERWLLIGGAVMVVIGLPMIFLGWWGASRTPYLFEQIPYMISGGILGLGLTLLGGLFYFAYWMTRQVQETRRQGEEMRDALASLSQSLAGGAPVGNGAAPAPPANGRFVATAKGTMFHRGDCVVVQGRTDVRAVSPDDPAFTPCKICDPLAAVS